MRRPWKWYATAHMSKHFASSTFRPKHALSLGVLLLEVDLNSHQPAIAKRMLLGEVSSKQNTSFYGYFEMIFMAKKSKLMAKHQLQVNLLSLHACCIYSKSVFQCK